MNPRPWQYDGVLTKGPGGRLAQVVEPRWWQLDRLLDLYMHSESVVTVSFVQCGREVECRARYVHD